MFDGVFKLHLWIQKEWHFLSKLLLKQTSLLHIRTLMSSGLLYLSHMYSQVIGRALSKEHSLRKMVGSSQDRKISMSLIPATGQPQETQPRDYLRKPLKKWSYFSQCGLNRKVKTIFMFESSFPKFILHRSWYTKEKLQKIFTIILFLWRYNLTSTLPCDEV